MEPSHGANEPSAKPQVGGLPSVSLLPAAQAVQLPPSTATIGAPQTAVPSTSTAPAAGPSAPPIPMVMVPGIPYPVPLATAIQLSALLQQQQLQNSQQAANQTQSVGVGMPPLGVSGGLLNGGHTAIATTAAPQAAPALPVASQVPTTTGAIASIAPTVTSSSPFATPSAATPLPTNSLAPTPQPNVPGAPLMTAMPGVPVIAAPLGTTAPAVPNGIVSPAVNSGFTPPVVSAPPVTMPIASSAPPGAPPLPGPMPPRPMAMLIQTANGPMLVSLPMPQVLPQPGGQAPGMLPAPGMIPAALRMQKIAGPTVVMPSAGSLRQMQVVNENSEPLSTHTLQGRQARVLHATPQAWMAVRAASEAKQSDDADKSVVIIERDVANAQKMTVRMAVDKDLAPQGNIRLPRVAASGVGAPANATTSTVLIDHETSKPTTALSISDTPLRTAHPRSQFYFTPPDGKPVPVGASDQPPLTYFARGLPSKRNSDGGMTYEQVMKLKTWFARHWASPRPDAEALRSLSEDTGLDPASVESWIRYECRRNFDPEKLAGLEPSLQQFLKPLAAKDKKVGKAKRSRKGDLETEEDVEVASSMSATQLQLQPISESTAAAAHVGGVTVALHAMAQEGKTVVDANPVDRQPLASGKDCVIIKNGTNGSAGSGLMFTSGGIPVNLPNGTIVGSEGTVMIPAKALPPGAMTLAPSIHVDANLLWAADIAEEAVIPFDMQLQQYKHDTQEQRRQQRLAVKQRVMQQRADDDQAAAQKPAAAKKGNAAQAASGRKRKREDTSTASEEQTATNTNTNTGQSNPLLSWALLTTSIAGPGFPPLPPNVKPINADGSIPRDAEFVVVPTSSCLMVAKVSNEPEGPALIPMGALSDTANPLAGDWTVGSVEDAFAAVLPPAHEHDDEPEAPEGIIPGLLGSGGRMRGDSMGYRLRASSTSSRFSEFPADAYFGLHGHDLHSADDSFLSSIHSVSGLTRGRERTRSGSLDVLAMISMSDYEESKGRSLTEFPQVHDTDVNVGVSRLRTLSQDLHELHHPHLRTRTLSQDMSRIPHVSTSPSLRDARLPPRDRLSSVNLDVDINEQVPH